ncbi:histidine kinase [Clostridium sardiniense]|uniref:Histidine kinase n=1 Tax=Clostridium sardiniense TaxID=29369 RepID=A0ABS7L171_CLOSR|nr:histidine kinase [Clostridium sardiniense]MBY0756497.1 histidine kinase [Clostridium sardiniense]MDQ0460243.1 hypothetical protein [Clostridium sardiniense]
MSNNERLLTVKDLASRWQKTELTIRRYVSEGVLTPCKGVPGVMFAPSYIRELEGVKLDKMSPTERKRLEDRIIKLEKIIQLQSEKLSEIINLGARSMELLIDVNKKDYI